MILDVCWKMNTLICLLLKTEKNVHDPWRTWWRWMSFISRRCFDLSQRVFYVLHVFVRKLHMYWSSASLAWPFGWFSCGWLWPHHLWLPPAFNETQCFDVWRAYSNCVLSSIPGQDMFSNASHELCAFPPCHSICFTYIFLFFLPFHKFINNWYMLQKWWEFLHYAPYCS